MTNKSLKIQQEIEKAEAFQAGVNSAMMIGQHASPYIPQERPREGVGGTDEHPFDDFGNDRNPPVINPATGKPEWAGTNQGMTIAHGEGRGPQPKYHDEYNRPLKFPPWMHINPRGEQIEIPWQKKEYMKDHSQFFPEQQANVNYGSPTERDKWLQLFQGPGGSLRNIKDPDLRKLILQRGAMKADASNNIRRLQPNHQTVLDDDRPGKLKIIKTFKPKA